MVDASLSISAPRPRAATPQAATPPAASPGAVPSAPPFADLLPAQPPPGAAQPGAAQPGASQPGANTAGTGVSGTAASSSRTTAGGAPAQVASPAAAAAPVPAAPKPATPSAFHVLLSELNPLQYVPVVGTIYRAVTGDTIPEAARIAGGLVVSGLTGGPIGIAMNVGATLLEHLVGIDPEKIGDRLLAELGIGHATPAHAPTVLASAAPSPAATTPAPAVASTPDAATAPASSAPASSAPASSARPWSPAQLAAYGVTGAADGTLRRGTMSGADVLNSLELARIAAPAAA